MQTYVAEIDGRAIFAFRADNVGCAQAWLDIHAVMRHALETIHSDGRRIWNGRAPIVARKATSAEATIWSGLSDEVAGDDLFQEPDNITVWLIPTSDDRRVGEKTNKPLPEGSGSNSTKPNCPS
jgi:hypothetical protein